MILYLSGAFPSIMDRAASAGGVCHQGGYTTVAFFWDNGLLQTPSGLAIVEIQGTVNSSLSPEQHTADGALPLGKLMFPLYDPRMTKDDTSWHKRVYLYIGKHQRLTGEVKKLLRPIAVLRRKSPADASEERATPGGGSDRSLWERAVSERSRSDISF
ncbi:hypothetical protein KC363_g20 [Hortaea werneckii]|nr:hypothetical protein KC363_g20 [Hortaea werneckii]